MVSTAPVTNVQATCSPLAFTVGGSIAGLTGAGLVLANGSDTVRPGAGATSFVFPTPVALGGSYTVTVQTQPAGQTCAVAGTFPATMGSANVGNVVVSCGTTSTFTLVAGQETCPAQPIVDGTGAAASLNPQIKGAALDTAGNYYSFDGGRVRKVTPTGVVTTIAGGPPGNGILVDGTGAAAVFAGSVFSTPQGLVVDHSGNIFVSDLSAIRKVSSGGVVTTIAGAAAWGGVDGTGTAARFYGPTGLAFDSAGNVLVVDGGNSAIRRIDAAGAVTTLTKNGSGFVAGAIGTSAQLYVPSQSSVAVDAAGTMYLGGHDYPIAYAITTSGVLSAFAGSHTSGFADGVGAAATFSGPVDFSFDAAGNLYVTDNLGTAMRKITPAALVTTPVVASNFSNIGPGAPAPAGALVLALCPSDPRARHAEWQLLHHRRLLAAEDRALTHSAVTEGKHALRAATASLRAAPEAALDRPFEEVGHNASPKGALKVGWRSGARIRCIAYIRASSGSSRGVRMAGAAGHTKDAVGVPCLI
jgi:hypothetical protein